MKRVSVDIGGTFTDCFVCWNSRYVEGKALTTHHNLALGFNESLADACAQLGVDSSTLLSQVDSVRYATTLGTNALIERRGPRIGLLVTAGFKHSIPLSRARGYGEGLSEQEQMDVPNARRPVPLVPIPMICEIRERIDYLGKVFWKLDEEDVRRCEPYSRVAHARDFSRGVSCPSSRCHSDAPVSPGSRAQG
jgi:N-methylhydantoinase A